MISRALISGRELSTSFPGFSQVREPWEQGWGAMVDKSTDRENDVMVRQFVFQFVFFRARVFPKNYKFKTVKVIVKYKNKTNR